MYLRLQVRKCALLYSLSVCALCMCLYGNVQLCPLLISQHVAVLRAYLVPNHRLHSRDFTSASMQSAPKTAFKQKVLTQDVVAGSRHCDSVLMHLCQIKCFDMYVHMLDAVVL